MGILPLTFEIRKLFSRFILTGDYSSNIQTVIQQQCQDTVLKTHYYWLSYTCKTEFHTSLIPGLTFCLYKPTSCKLHEHCHTGI